VRAVLRALSVPAGNDRGPLFMDQVFAALHQVTPERLPIRFMALRSEGQVTLALDFPNELQPSIEGQLYAQYPDAKLVPLPDTVFPEGTVHWTAAVELHPDLFPIRRYAQFEDPLSRQLADPLTAMLTALATDPSLHADIAFEVRPAEHYHAHRRQTCIRRLADPFFHRHHRLGTLYRTLALSPWRPVRLLGWLYQRSLPRHPERTPDFAQSGTRAHEREEDLAAANDKAGRPLFATTLQLHVSGPPAREADAHRKLQELFGTLGQFAASRRTAFRVSRIRRSPNRPRLSRRSFLLSTEELATLWHPPTSIVKAPTMTIVESREAEPPVRLPTLRDDPELAVLGQAQFRGQRQLCGLLPDDRRRHLLIEGKTGMGKSTLLQRLIGSDIAAGRGVALLDPHGDLCESVLAAVPSHRSNDVVLFDVADASHPLAFNVMSCAQTSQRALTASGIVAAFKKIWGEFFGPRMEHILRNTLLTLLDIPGSTLLSVVRMLGDAEFRHAIVDQVHDPVLRNFWLREFASMPPKLQAEAVAPIYNKVGQLISNPLLRNILGQARSTLNLRNIMDEGKVLLINLSKGRVGEDASALLGAFLVTALQQAAMSRADRREDDRRDFYAYIDEFQNFATDAFATILSEARKYRLNLTVANQYLDQIDPVTRSAVFGNIGSMIVFQVGVQDAELLAEQLGGDLTPRDLLTLPRFQTYTRLLIDGQPSRPFSLRTLPPTGHSERHRLRSLSIRRYCAQRYGRPVERVEREIAAAFPA
jgi:hypothetical protein